MDKRITKEEIAKIEEQLSDSLSANRRKAAKNIQKYTIKELGDSLFKAYQKEKKDKRTWETQMEMLNALGKIKYMPILPDLKEIIAENKKLDAITSSAVLAFVRLTRNDNSDIKPIMDLLEFGNISVIDGAMEALNFDSMMPSDYDVEKLIKRFEEIPEDKLFVRGCGDPRTSLLSVMSCWNKKYTHDFISKYLDSTDDDLKYYAEAALKGKRYQ